MERWGSHGRWTIENARSRFLSKTRRAKSGCLEWTGAIGSHGRYGSVAHRGRRLLAHRLAWILFVGEDPGERCVLHRCDNGLCVSIDHLFLGTQGDNVHDMESKRRSRHPSGEAHGRSKLTKRDVAEIRRRRARGETLRGLAKDFSVSHPTIANIVHNRGWLTK